VPFASKVMFMLFWDNNGPILEHYQYHGRWSVVHGIVLCLKRN